MFVRLRNFGRVICRLYSPSSAHIGYYKCSQTIRHANTLMLDNLKFTLRRLGMLNPFGETMHEDALKYHNTKDDISAAYIVTNHFKLKSICLSNFRTCKGVTRRIAQLYVLDLRLKRSKLFRTRRPRGSHSDFSGFLILVFYKFSKF